MSAEKEKPEQYIVRFPPGMREKIKQNAIMCQRSMNAEIIYHLKCAYSAKNKEADARA